MPSDKSKSELYGALLPLLNSRRVDLLDNKRLTSQFLGLERRTARGGRDSIDHAPGAHDDLVNAVAGSLVAAAHVPAQTPIICPIIVSRPRYDPFADNRDWTPEHVLNDTRTSGFSMRDF